MRDFYQKWIHIYDDYRRVVPSYASSALAFYLLLILIPAFSLVAVGTSLLNIDMTLVEEILKSVVTPYYASMLIGILESRSIDTMALITIIISLYTVSRGVGNVYEVSKNMYGEDKNEGFLGYYFYTIRVTIVLLVLFIGIIAVMAIGPLAYIFHFLYSFFGFRHIFLYFLMVFCLMSIYLIVPRMKVHWSDAFEGAMIASAFMLVLYYGLNIYFQFADFQNVYGPLAFIVVILFVFNLAAEVFYMGMYMTHLFYVRRKEDEKRTSRN